MINQNPQNLNFYGFVPNQQLFNAQKPDFAKHANYAQQIIAHQQIANLQAMQDMQQIMQLNHPNTFAQFDEPTNFMTQQSQSIVPLHQTIQDDNVSELSDNVDLHDESTMNELKITIKRWLELDDEINTLREAIVSRNKEKQQLSTYISKFMKSNEIPYFDFDNGQKLELKSSIRKQSLNKTWVCDTLSKFLDKQKADKIKVALLDQRPITQSNRLKRVKPKQSKGGFILK